MDYKKEIENHRDFWEPVLGAEACNNPPSDVMIEEEAQIKLELLVLEKLYKDELLDTDGWDTYCRPGTFHKFYGFFGKLAVKYADADKMTGFKNPENIILSNFYPSVFWIPLRTLIQDIHIKKDSGELTGADSREEYQDYQDRFLSSREYINNLCEKYPEMKRLIFKQILYTVDELKRIRDSIKQDRDTLAQDFFHEEKYKKILNIKCGMSDAHNMGQTVAEVYFDNGKRLIYKPRNLQKDRIFLQTYADFCDELKVPLQIPAILVKGTYSWEEYVEVQECTFEQEIERYFERLGILLFLCYLTDAEDMHGENILASGEYPIPIDLETMPGYQTYKYAETAESKVCETLRHSVMKTGILPEPVWNKNGNGIILNAINRGGILKTPFKVPVVCDGDNANIHIEYRQAEREVLNSLPVWKGEAVHPVAYTRSLMQGFCSAYLLFMARKEKIIIKMKGLFGGESRCLFRHTQQYYMYLQSSYYPAILESTTRRRLFLHVVDRNASHQNLLPYERDSLFNMNIPIFHFQGNSRALVDGNGKTYPDFLGSSLEENWTRKLDMLSMQDMERQAAFIKYSMGLLDDRVYMHRKADICPVGERTEGFRFRIKRQINMIADQMCSLAFIGDNDDIEFCVLRPGKTSAEEFGPSGMYLYHGLAGISVFFAAVLRSESCGLYEYMFHTIMQKMFRYTDNCCRKAESLAVGGMGAFEGEGSLITAYFMLYRITEDKKYLNYAQLHAQFVKKLWRAEKSMDYLTGLAGLVWVFCQLFQMTNQREYINEAARMGEQIWGNCEIADNGAGWRPRKGMSPLTGLAHGNAGLLMAFGALLEQTGDIRYHEKIDQLLEYEDRFMKTGNWMDLRHPEGERLCNNAWCHGAAGILLSRLQLKRAGYPDEAGIVERDVQYCRKIFLEPEEPQELCLCHGLSGLYLALCCYLKDRADKEMELEMKGLGERILIQVEEKQIPAREKCNPALMTGITGVGLALYCIQENF